MAASLNYQNTMKNIYFLTALLLSVVSFGQTTIDALVTVTFPGEVTKKDTVVSNMPILSYSSLEGNAMYSIERIIIDSSEDELNNLPSDLESLDTFYKGFENGYKKSLLAMGFRPGSSNEFIINSYKGRQVSFSQNNLKAVESRILILNEYVYTLTYFNQMDFNEQKKNAFFNSMVIDITKKPQQMLGKPQEYKWGYMFGQAVVYILVIGGVLYFIFRKKKKQ